MKIIAAENWRQQNVQILCEVPLCALESDYIVQGVRLCFLHKISHEQRGRNPVTYFKWKKVSR